MVKTGITGGEKLSNTKSLALSEAIKNVVGRTYEFSLQCQFERGMVSTGISDHVMLKTTA